MSNNENYRTQTMACLSPLVENADWKAVDSAKDDSCECVRFARCGEKACWVSRKDNIRVCDYHRFVYEVICVTNSVNESEHV